MGLTTGIEWCDGTFSAWRGCAKVDSGCENCYAEANAGRNLGLFGTWGTEGQGGTRILSADDYWLAPLRANKKAERDRVRFRMFAGSIHDVFEQWDGPVHDHKGQVVVARGGRWVAREEAGKEARPLTVDDVRERLLALVARTPWIDWLFLTKRTRFVMPTVRRLAERAGSAGGDLAATWAGGKPPANVWVGASVSDQKTLWLHAEWLREIPAKIRFVSAEPLLGPLDLSPWFGKDRGLLAGGDAFNWLIVGGESGSRDVVRPCSVEWLRSAVAQCREAGLSVFVKQLGSAPFDVRDELGKPRRTINLRVRSFKGDDPADLPDDLHVKQFPDTEFGDDLLT